MIHPSNRLHSQIFMVNFKSSYSRCGCIVIISWFSFWYRFFLNVCMVFICRFDSLDRNLHVVTVLNKHTHLKVTSVFLSWQNIMSLLFNQNKSKMLHKDRKVNRIIPSWPPSSGNRTSSVVFTEWPPAGGFVCVMEMRQSCRWLSVEAETSYLVPSMVATHFLLWNCNIMDC